MTFKVGDRVVRVDAGGGNTIWRVGEEGTLVEYLRKEFKNALWRIYLGDKKGSINLYQKRFKLKEERKEEEEYVTIKNVKVEVRTGDKDVLRTYAIITYSDGSKEEYLAKEEYPGEY